MREPRLEVEERWSWGVELADRMVMCVFVKRWSRGNIFATNMALNNLSLVREELMSVRSSAAVGVGLLARIL